LAAVAIVAYAFGRAAQRGQPKAALELEQAIPPPSLVLSASQTCIEPNELERGLIEAAVDALVFSSEESGFFGIGAEQFLSHPRYRRTDGTIQVLCDIPELFVKASELIRNSDHLRKGRIVEYGLKLIARLPNPGEQLAKVVAASAFNQTPQEPGIFPKRDIRPLARSTLASLGPLARPYADQAFAQISIEDSMGTGAAQIAVAGGHRDALGTVERLMADKLASRPKEHVIPYGERNRLYEMAYALAFGGAQARQHVAPVRDLMSRKIQSWAPPFGMVELPPRRMCEVFVKIMREPVSDPELKYCSDTNRPYEQ
jgi:hypothetical protein